MGSSAAGQILEQKADAMLKPAGVNLARKSLGQRVTGLLWWNQIHIRKHSTKNEDIHSTT